MSKPDLEQRIHALERQLQESRLENQRIKSDARFRLPKLLIATLAVVVVLGLVGWAIQRLLSTQDPVPVSIRRGAHFDIYIPRQNKLPSGFTFDKSSIGLEDQGQAVVYAISTPSGSRLVVSNQQKPSAAALSLFYKNQMPLTIPVTTPVGVAALGSLNNETVVSLPTNTNTWILMTAPLNFSQRQIQKMLQTLERAQ
jgi:hypothetical protein